MRIAPMLCLAVSGLALGSCSAQRFDFDTCTDSSQCRDAFGFGWSCGDDGLCASIAQHPRCSSTWPEDLFLRPEEYGDHIVIGSVFQSAFELEVKAARLAVRQVNDHQGLDGTDFAIVECTNDESITLDNLSVQEATEEVVRYLSQDLGVPAIIGPATSTNTEIAYNTASPQGTVVISPSATSPALTALDGLSPSDADPGLLWRTAPPDSLQGFVIASDMTDRGIDYAAVIAQTGAYGEGLADVFLENFTSLGGVGELFLFDSNTTRDDAVSNVAAGSFDEVLFISSDVSDCAAFMNSAQAFGSPFDGMTLFMTDAAFNTQLFDEAGAAAPLYPNVRGTRPAVPTSRREYLDFRSAFASSYGGEDADDSGFTAYAYDAAWLSIYGSAWSWYQTGAITGTGIAQGLRQVSCRSCEPISIRSINWAEIRQNFAEGREVDLEGASGSLDFDPATEETSAAIDIWRISPGPEFETVDTIEP